MSTPEQRRSQTERTRRWRAKRKALGLRDRPPARFVNNKDKTHCLRGHEFTPENTIHQRRNGGVQRRCKTCKYEAAKLVRAAKPKKLVRCDGRPVRRPCEHGLPAINQCKICRNFEKAQARRRYEETPQGKLKKLERQAKKRKTDRVYRWRMQVPPLDIAAARKRAVELALAKVAKTSCTQPELSQDKDKQMTNCPMLV